MELDVNYALGVIVGCTALIIAFKAWSSGLASKH